jgi:hypothetical protein
MVKYESSLGEIIIEPEERKAKKGYRVDVRFNREHNFSCSGITAFIETAGSESDVIKILRGDSNQEIRKVAKSVSKRNLNPIKYLLSMR